MIKQLVLASKNQGKIREIKAILADTNIELLSMNDFSIGDIEEPHPTFIENALAKARAVSAHTHLPALADDSGLCVAALGFKPGVHSARYAGENATDEDNNRQLLEALKDHDNRQAFYYCAMVLVQYPEDPQPLISEGRWYGEIIQNPVGNNGFGYDPLFFLSKFNQTAAQLSPEDKNRISHRAIALQQLKQKMEALAQDQP